MNRLWPCFLAAVLCLGALLPGLPYGYFQLVRWGVCMAGAYAAFQCFKVNLEGLGWAAFAVALLFNPLVKIHLGRELWWWADLAAAAFLIYLPLRGWRERV